MQELANISAPTGHEPTRDEVEHLCRTDLDFFASFCMPDVATAPFPDEYREIWIYLIGSIAQIGFAEVFRMALGLPRGHAKTTLIKLLVSYAILYSLADFMLVICATEDLAMNFLSDVDDILSSPNVKQIYGSWEAAKGTDTREKKTARFMGRDVILASIGAGSSVRGLNIKNKRPDFIIFDDAQTEKNDESPTERKRLLKWIVGTAIKLRSPVRCAVVYIGNMYSEECILNQLKGSPGWVSFITGAILADGTALFPAIKPIEALIEEYQHDASLGEADTWFAEVQNDPSGRTAMLILDGQLPLAPINTNLGESIGAFITIDPAGSKKTSDDNVICGHAMLPEDINLVAEIDNGKYNPEEVIDKAIAMAMRLNATHIFVESVSYQATLKFWMDKYLEKYGLHDIITVLPVPFSKASKLARIKAWLQNVYADAYYILRMEDKNKLLFQGLQFKVERTDNTDDMLDCASMGTTVLGEYKHMLIAASPSFMQVSTAKVRTNNTPIDSIRRRSSHGRR